jgi:tetratricopeptide (TPR) repeat protein
MADGGRMTRMSLVFVLLVALVATARAEGDNRTVAREAFREAARRYDLGDYPKALELFKLAYLNFEEPKILFNIGQCQRQMSQKVEAITAYRSYLRKVPDASNRDEVQHLIQQLEAAIAVEQSAKNAPPAALVMPSPVPSVVMAPAPVAPTPVYKKWWLWTSVVIAAAAVGTAIGVGVYESQPGERSYSVHVP